MLRFGQVNILTRPGCLVGGQNPCRRANSATLIVDRGLSICLRKKRGFPAEVKCFLCFAFFMLDANLPAISSNPDDNRNDLFEGMEDYFRLHSDLSLVGNF